MTFGYRSAVLLLLLCSVLLGGCATSPPKQPANICAVFEEKRSWYKHARRASERWDSSIPVMMAILYQESGYRANAKPPRKKYLWVIPGPRKSSARGYAQAKSATWKSYERATSNNGDRNKFKDAIDFVGWYNSVSYRRNRIARNDTYHLYLAYHEGHGGFNRRTYRNKKWLKDVAHKVSGRSKRYQAQLEGCERHLRRRWWFF